MQCKTLLFSFLLFLLAIPGYAQMAPDFNLVDSDGQTHRLYQDYLENGKVALIKIFYTSCPPCNQVAPHLEELYQEWGAGENDVEFFELSIQNFDDDTRINNFKSQHGITFPSIGADGGSVQATLPYRSGDFGQYFGTPTFVVVAPNGSVDFDVDGFGINGLIEALEASFTNAGAQKPSTTSVSDINDYRNNVTAVPNPFDQVTQINIETKVAGHLTYELFDILGNKVQNADIGRIEVGKHSYTYDYANIRAGAYILRMSVDGRPLKSIKLIKRS